MPTHETPVTTDMYSAFRAEDFSGIPSNDWYLMGPGEDSRIKVQKNFIASDESDNPGIDYTKVGTIDYKSLETSYYGLLSDAIETGDDVFYEQVARKLAELYRHQEVARLVGSFVMNERLVNQQHSLKATMDKALESGDDDAYEKAGSKLDQTRAHKEVLRRNGREAINKTLSANRAETMNEEIFGQLEQRDFDIALAPYVASAQTLTDTLPEARDLLERVGDAWDRNPGSYDFAIEPETLALLKGDLLETFPRLGDALAPHEVRKVGMDETVEWTNKVLEAIGLDDKNWHANKVIGSNKSADTKVREKVIEFGDGRAEFASTTAMNETNVHEAIGHAYRAAQAQAQQDPSLHSKMPGTDDFEESFATALQQLISGKPRIAGQRYVLAYGLGKGMDRGGEPRNFRETYEMLYDMVVIDDTSAGKQLDRQASQVKAYKESNRIRRGGTLDARDLSYFLGCKKSYTWMNEIAKLPAEQRKAKLAWVLSGLFDPTNPEQADKFPQVGVGEV
ncbi:MAG: hypothetical protein JWO07_235 [Candidatus Saccharibacteria bacterium]|nr:hypothetical protein [Candidatus Saccharibacteria bacterium]